MAILKSTLAVSSVLPQHFPKFSNQSVILSHSLFPNTFIYIHTQPIFVFITSCISISTINKLRMDNSLKRKRVITELVQGREFAKQLQNLLHNPSPMDDCSVSAKHLAVKILGSFTESLSHVLSSDQSSTGDCQIQTIAQVGSSCSSDQTSQNSGESKKGPEGIDQRGRYKRRKNSEARIKISRTMEDGYSWRKYGQKVILNDKYPRCYFRCTHKTDEDCKALKQVQQIEENNNDNIMFHITYFGQHTCRGTNKSSVSDSENARTTSVMVNFGSNNTQSGKHFSHACVKEESFDSSVWKDILALEQSRVYDSIGMDLGDFIKCVDFSNDFKLDEIY